MSLGTQTFAKLQNPIGVYDLCRWDSFLISKKEQPNKDALYQYEDFRVNKYIVSKNISPLPLHKGSFCVKY